MREIHIHESDVNEGIYIYLTDSYSVLNTPTVTELYVMSRITVRLLSIRYRIQTRPDLPTMLIRGKNHNLHVNMLFLNFNTEEEDLCKLWVSVRSSY